MTIGVDRSWQDNTTISGTRLCFMWRANLTAGLQHNDYLNNISVVPAHFPPCIMFCWLKQNTGFWLSSPPFFVKGIWFSDLLSYLYSFCQTGHRESRQERIEKQIEWPRQSLPGGNVVRVWVVALHSSTPDLDSCLCCLHDKTGWEFLIVYTYSIHYNRASSLLGALSEVWQWREKCAALKFINCDSTHSTMGTERRYYSSNQIKFDWSHTHI
jgi:hypothetical protein